MRGFVITRDALVLGGKSICRNSRLDYDNANSKALKLQRKFKLQQGELQMRTRNCEVCWHNMELEMIVSRPTYNQVIH